MSNFYLCDYCAAHHWTTEDGLFVCESRPSQLEKVVMLDHNGRGGGDGRMTATDELRRMLDERGVFWVDIPLANMKLTCWKSCDEQDGYCYFEESAFGVTNLTISNLTPEQAIAATLGPKVTGDTSDGYHTFNELYHHRAVLFSVIVRDHRELAWKSMRHHDGTMYDGMFIVGIETPEGQATYHYDIDPYWDMFNCKELDQAPEWDGHTPSEAIERIATLGSGTCRIIEAELDDEGNKLLTIEPYPDATSNDEWFGIMGVCSECGEYVPKMGYCPNCGSKVVTDG